LLDEIEKANKGILDLLLQALDEGYVTDSLGSRVSLSNNIIIATSNAGAVEIKEGVKDGIDYQSLKDRVFEIVQKEGIFKPEFLNRFDGLIVFRPLSAPEILKVAELMYAQLQEEYLKKGYKIELEKGVLELMAKEGYQPELGARPMRRVFQDKLETYLADEILSGNLKKGEPYLVITASLYGQNLPT
jgi:ATP-dependent Clp protease ATP-binding subunit ClpA